MNIVIANEVKQSMHVHTRGLLRRITLLAMTGMLALGLPACANKGKLKSPSQIKAQEAKKQAKAAKAAAGEGGLDIMQTDIEDREPDNARDLYEPKPVGPQPGPVIDSTGKGMLEH